MGVAQHTEMKWLLSNYLSLMCESFLYFRQLQYLVIEHLFVICCSIFCKFCSSFCFSYSLFKSHRCNVTPVTRWRQWLEMGATWLKTYFYCGMENPLSTIHETIIIHELQPSINSVQPFCRQ